MFVADPSTLSKEQLEEELAAQAAHIDAGLCRYLELAAECERRLPWAGDGTTFASWLAWRCSLLPRQAREHERIGKRLAELPATRAAFSRGELSYAKVSVLTRIAEPETEERLLEVAEAMTASQLERAVGAYRQLAREEAAEQQEREFLRYDWTDDGSFSMRARLAAEDGALVLRALEAGREAPWESRRDDAPQADASEPTHEHARPSHAEALVAMADLALAGSDRHRTGGERYQVVVHVDALTLAHDVDGRCELADGRALAAETARRLSCDGSIVDLLERNGEPLSLGRKRRTISPALRRALAARDRGCRFPGCERTRFVDGHHLQHWSQGGETNLDDLVSLCGRHHRLVHERGYCVSFDDDGEVHFVNQYGIAIPSVPRPPPPSSHDALRDQHRRRRLLIDGKTCRNGTGDRMELILAVDALLSA
jgi:Domain of unknown function (DUF222)/HNH endonuclease